MAFKCSIRHKIASKCMQVFESIVAKFLLIISICSIIYSNNWLSVYINFSFLILAIFSLITYGQCYRKANPLLAIPMLINHTVFIFWIFIWLYASIASITTGHLWSLEWLGGPKSSREVGSRDVRDPNYINPDETHPETKKSITYGSIIMGVSLLIMVLKIIGWRIAKTTFNELRQKSLQMSDDDDGFNSPPPPFPHNDSGEYTDFDNSRDYDPYNNRNNPDDSLTNNDSEYGQSNRRPPGKYGKLVQELNRQQHMNQGPKEAERVKFMVPPQQKGLSSTSSFVESQF
ncbi:unnamed protein product [Auanema sp. JU1783]|nr:unnamed protein product [Auanema sp. JU1783]